MWSVSILVLAVLIHSFGLFAIRNAIRPIGCGMATEDISSSGLHL